MYCLFEFNKVININGLHIYHVRMYINTISKEYYLSIGCMNFATLKELKAEAEHREGLYKVSLYNAKIKIVEDIINEVLR